MAIYYSFTVELNHLSGPYKADTIAVLPVGTSNAYFKRREKTHNVLGKSCNSGLRYESVYHHQVVLVGHRVRDQLSYFNVQLIKQEAP